MPRFNGTAHTLVLSVSNHEPLAFVLRQAQDER
jgi:hypothetical protein